MASSSSQIQMICGGCRQTIVAPPGSAGMVVACPLCGVHLRVPRQDGGFAEFFDEAISDPALEPKPRRANGSPLAAGGTNESQARYVDNSRPKFDAVAAAAEARRERAKTDLISGLVYLLISWGMLLGGMFLNVFFCFAPVLFVIGLFHLGRGMLAAFGVE